MARQLLDDEIVIIDKFIENFDIPRLLYLYEDPIISDHFVQFMLEERDMDIIKIYNDFIEFGKLPTPPSRINETSSSTEPQLTYPEYTCFIAKSNRGLESWNSPTKESIHFRLSDLCAARRRNGPNEWFTVEDCNECLIHEPLETAMYILETFDEFEYDRYITIDLNCDCKNREMECQSIETLTAEESIEEQIAQYSLEDTSSQAGTSSMSAVEPLASKRVESKIINNYDIKQIFINSSTTISTRSDFSKSLSANIFEGDDNQSLSSDEETFRQDGSIILSSGVKRGTSSIIIPHSFASFFTKYIAQGEATILRRQGTMLKLEVPTPIAVRYQKEFSKRARLKR